MHSVQSNTILVEKVDHVRGDLVTLVVSKPQGIDSINEILHDLRALQTTALSLGFIGLKYHQTEGESGA